MRGRPAKEAALQALLPFGDAPHGWLGCTPGPARLGEPPAGKR